MGYRSVVRMLVLTNKMHFPEFIQTLHNKVVASNHKEDTAWLCEPSRWGFTFDKIDCKDPDCFHEISVFSFYIDYIKWYDMHWLQDVLEGFALGFALARAGEERNDLELENRTFCHNLPKSIPNTAQAKLDQQLDYLLCDSLDFNIEIVSSIESTEIAVPISAEAIRNTDTVRSLLIKYMGGPSNTCYGWEGTPRILSKDMLVMLYEPVGEIKTATCVPIVTYESICVRVKPEFFDALRKVRGYRTNQTLVEIIDFLAAKQL